MGWMEALVVGFGVCPSHDMMMSRLESVNWMNG